MFDRLGDPYQIWCIMMYALFICPSKFLNKPLLALGYRYLHHKPWHFRCFNPKNWGPRLNPFTVPRARCRSPMWCWRSCCWDPSICMETQGTVLKWWYPKIIQNWLLPMIFNGKNPMVCCTNLLDYFRTPPYSSYIVVTILIFRVPYVKYGSYIATAILIFVVPKFCHVWLTPRCSLHTSQVSGRKTATGNGNMLHFIHLPVVEFSVKAQVPTCLSVVEPPGTSMGWGFSHLMNFASHWWTLSTQVWASPAAVPWCGQDILARNANVRGVAGMYHAQVIAGPSIDIDVQYHTIKYNKYTNLTLDSR